MSNFVEIKDKDGVTLGQLPVSKEGGRLRNIVYMTESGVYEKPAWLKFVIVKGVAGGGGGGGCPAATTAQRALSGAGGGGGYFEKRINTGDLVTSETVTVGAGGNGGAAGGNEGQTGGTTSFGAHCSATGGVGGLLGLAFAETAWGTRTGAAGGIATGGDINLSGSPSVTAAILNGYNITLPFGGACFLGASAVVAYDQTANGLPYGGGGAGVCLAAGMSARAGGDGAPGIVIIEEYE